MMMMKIIMMKMVMMMMMMTMMMTMMKMMTHLARSCQLYGRSYACQRPCRRLVLHYNACLHTSLTLQSNALHCTVLRFTLLHFTVS